MIELKLTPAEFDLFVSLLGKADPQGIYTSKELIQRMNEGLTAWKNTLSPNPTEEWTNEKSKAKK